MVWSKVPFKKSFNFKKPPLQLIKVFHLENVLLLFMFRKLMRDIQKVKILTKISKVHVFKKTCVFRYTSYYFLSKLKHFCSLGVSFCIHIFHYPHNQSFTVPFTSSSSESAPHLNEPLARWRYDSHWDQEGWAKHPT